MHKPGTKLIHISPTLKLYLFYSFINNNGELNCNKEFVFHPSSRIFSMPPPHICKRPALSINQIEVKNRFRISEIQIVSFVFVFLFSFLVSHLMRFPLIKGVLCLSLLKLRLGKNAQQIGKPS